MNDELVARLTRNRDELLNALADLSEEQISTRRAAGEWTIKDVVGHITYWEQITLDHIREALTEGMPRPTSPKDPEEKINAREIKRRKGWKWARVRAEFQKVRGALIERAARLTEMELGFIVPQPWLGRQDQFYSIGQMIQTDAIDHSAEHIAKIKLGSVTDGP